MCAAHGTLRCPCLRLRKIYAGQSVNQFAFAFGSLCGLLGSALGFWLWLRWLGARRDVAPSDDDWLDRYDDTHQLPPSSSGRRRRWWSTRSRGRIVAANPAALRSLGYSLEEVRGLSLGRALQRRGGRRHGELLGKIRTRATRAPLEMRQRCKDGSQRSVEADLLPARASATSSGARRGGARRHRAPQGRERSCWRSTRSSTAWRTTTS